ncbi:hypothetical protein [uncultured Brevundimonas sp.]|uniref:hypothetical protein n=1 Tax=uncultured Brevundimonas sp. TaxID=213418 RepID=UPI002593FCFC|nr:hypothetical protein [uncultured Brevundimonas sp.]
MTLSRTLMATVALFGLSGFADAPVRYVISYSVSDHGVTQMSGETLIAEDGDVSLEGSDPTGGHGFYASLHSTGEELQLDTRLWRGNDMLAAPALAIAKGGQAKMVIGGDQRRIVIEIVPAD